MIVERVRMDDYGLVTDADNKAKKFLNAKDWNSRVVDMLRSLLS
jgi:hypothetical protein